MKEKSQKLSFDEDITCWIDAVVVINELEYVWPFMDEGIITF